MCTPETNFIPSSELQEVWPGAVDVIVSTGSSDTYFMQLFDAALSLATEHPRWGEVDVQMRETEHAGERWYTVALLEPIGTSTKASPVG